MIALMVLCLVPIYYIAKSKGYNAMVACVISGVIAFLPSLSHALFSWFPVLPCVDLTVPLIVLVVVWLLPARKGAPGKAYLKITFQCPECKHNVSRCGGMSLIMELVVAMGMATMLAACFSMAVRGTRQLQDKLEAQSQAIVVLQNVLERVEAAQPARDSALVTRILDEEFKLSPLAERRGVHSICDTAGKRVSLRVVGAGGQPLAGMELKP
jgi:hypothetical protein